MSRDTRKSTNSPTRSSGSTGSHGGRVTFAVTPGPVMYQKLGIYADRRSLSMADAINQCLYLGVWLSELFDKLDVTDPSTLSLAIQNTSTGEIKVFKPPKPPRNTTSAQQRSEQAGLKRTRPRLVKP